MLHRLRTVATTMMFAAGTTAVVLVMASPRTTMAEEIPDTDRMGEYEEEGMKFGNIVVKGELVADGSTPGGWSLVRTFENQSDAPERCMLEERVLRTETMPGARVTPAPVAVVQRNQTVALGPHEKKKIGIRLPEAVGAQITAGMRRKAWIEQAQQRALAAEKFDGAEMRATYMTFDVEYLSALPAGATAARAVDTGVTRPQGLSEIAPPAPVPMNPQARLAAFDDRL